MKAFVLAGGFGTRLRPMTCVRPKPLLPVGDRPIVRWIVDSLPSEVEEVVIAVNYLKEQLREYFSSLDYEREVIYVDEPRPLGTGGAVKNAEEYLDETFIVFNGDVFSSLDISGIVGFHKAKKGTGTIATFEVEDPSRYGIVGLDREKRITRFLEKPTPQEIFSNFINAGTYVLEPEVLDHIPKGKVSIEREVFPALAEEGRLFGYPFEGFWVDIGKSEDYLTAQQMALENILSLQNMGDSWVAETAEIGEEAIVEKSVVGENVKVGSHTQIVGSVIFHDTEIAEKARIKKSIVCGGCSVGEKVVLEKAVLGDFCTVNDGLWLAGVKVCPWKYVDEDTITSVVIR